MAVDERGPIGQPRFFGGGADDQAADLTLLGEEIYKRGTRMVLTMAERDDLVTAGIAYEGLEVYCTTDGVTYVRVDDEWRAFPYTEVVGIVASGGSFGANWSGQAAPNQPRIVREGNKRTLYGSIVGAVGASLTSMLTVAPADRPPTAGQRFIGIGFARSTTPTDSRAFSVTMTAGVIGYEAVTGSGLVLTWPYRLDGLSWWMD